MHYLRLSDGPTDRGSTMELEIRDAQLTPSTASDTAAQVCMNARGV